VILQPGRLLTRVSPGGPPPDPTTVANLAAWYMNEALAPYNNNDPLPSWADSSGAGRNLAAAANNRGIVVLSGGFPTGCKTLRQAQKLIGNHYNWLQTSALALNVTEFSFIQVFKYSGLSYYLWNNANDPDHKDSVFTQGFNICIMGSAYARVNVYLAARRYFQNSGDAFSPTAATPMILSCCFKKDTGPSPYKANARIRQNGVSKTLSTSLTANDLVGTATVPTLGGGVLTIDPANDGSAGVYIAETCLYSRQLSDAELNVVEKWLGWKFGIAVS
jgi:hypothetical protein